MQHGKAMEAGTTLEADAGRGPMPNGIHITIVVYGPVYTKLLSEITLFNLAAMVREIPDQLRRLSLVRIVTTPADMPTIEASRALRVLRQEIGVEVIDQAQLKGFSKHGDYGPMVETQRLVVIEAARRNAALFFVGPDQIYSRGAFKFFVDCLCRGYRMVIGPGTRIKRDAARPFLLDRIARSPDGTFALEPEEQIDAFFRYWHRINDQFLLESDEGIWWKAFVYHRPHPDELFIRFLQGPTLMAWPLKPKEDFDGFVDHQLPELSCRTWREIYVIDDARTCLALDMTDDTRFDIMDLSDFPRVFLLQQMFNHEAIKDMKLLYGLRSCRIHRGDRDAAQVSRWNGALARAMDPLIFIALAERIIRRRLGNGVASAFRALCVLNTHTLSFLLAPFMPRLLRKWKKVDPLRSPR